MSNQILPLIALALLAGEALARDPPRGHAPLKLAVTPAHITRGMTHHVTLRCELDVHSGSDIASVHWMRIRKKNSNEWSLVAEQREHAGTESHMDNVSAVGNLGSSLGEAYLEVEWAVAEDPVFGDYMCDALGIDDSLHFVVEKSLELSITEQNVTTKAVLDLLIQSNTEIREDSDEIAEDVKDNASFLNDLLARVIKLERQMEEHTHGGAGHVAVAPNDTITWPGGYFGLLKPKSGCPDDPFFHNANSSFVKFHSEPLSNNSCLDHHHDFHLSEPVVSSNASECFVNLRFCEASGETSSTPWPEGTYCVNWNIDHPCPARFQPGRVVLDQVDGTQSHAVDSSLVELSGTYTYLHFCCKETVPHDVSMALPRDSPFYLYRLGGTCQQVEGMSVTPEYIDIITENKINGDDGHGLHADTTIQPGQPTRIQLCYYSKDE